MKKLMMGSLAYFACTFSMEKDEPVGKFTIVHQPGSEQRFKDIESTIDTYVDLKKGGTILVKPLERLEGNQGRLIERDRTSLVSFIVNKINDIRGIERKPSSLVNKTPYDYIILSQAIKNRYNLGKNRVAYGKGQFFVLPQDKEPVEVHRKHIKTSFDESYEYFFPSMVKESIQKGAHFDLDTFPNGQYSLALKGKMGGTDEFLANALYYITWGGGIIASAFIVKQAVSTSGDLLEGAAKAGRIFTKLTDMAGYITELKNKPKKTLTPQEKDLLSMYNNSSKSVREQMKAPRYTTHYAVEQDALKNPKKYGFTEGSVPKAGDMIETACRMTNVKDNFLPEGVYQDMNGQFIDANGSIILPPQNEMPGTAFSQEHCVSMMNEVEGMRDSSLRIQDNARQAVLEPVMNCALKIGEITASGLIGFDDRVGAVIDCGAEVVNNTVTMMGGPHTDMNDVGRGFVEVGSMVAANASPDVLEVLAELTVNSVQMARGSTAAFLSIEKAAQCMYNIGMAIPEKRIAEAFCTIC